MYSANPLKHLSKIMLEKLTTFIQDKDSEFFFSFLLKERKKKMTKIPKTSVSPISESTTVALGDEVPSKFKTDLFLLV